MKVLFEPDLEVVENILEVLDDHVARQTAHIVGVRTTVREGQAFASGKVVSQGAPQLSVHILGRITTHVSLDEFLVLLAGTLFTSSPSVEASDRIYRARKKKISGQGGAALVVSFTFARGLECDVYALHYPSIEGAPNGFLHRFKITRSLLFHGRLLLQGEGTLYYCPS